MKKRYRKKLGKSVTAALFATSAIVMVTPTQANASPNVNQLIKQAQQSANLLKAFYDLESTSKVMYSVEFMSAYNKSSQDLIKAEEAVKKIQGSLSQKLLSDLKSAQDTHIKAARVIDAIKVAAELEKLHEEMEVYITKEEMNSHVVNLYDEFSYQLKKLEKVISRVYGEKNREKLRNEFLIDSKITKETIIYEVSQYLLLDDIEQQIVEGNVELAKENVKKLERLKKRAEQIKIAGNKLHPGKYPTLPNLQNLLVEKENDVMKGIFIHLTAQSKDEAKPTIYGNTEIEHIKKDLVITIPDDTYFELKNVIVEGNVILRGTGKITLTNVKTTGTIQVEDETTTSKKLMTTAIDSSLDVLIRNKSQINHLTILSPTQLNVPEQDNQINHLYIQPTLPDIIIKIDGNYLNTKVEVEGNNPEVIIGNNAKIIEMIVSSNATINAENDAYIESLIISELEKPSDIILKGDLSLTKVEIKDLNALIYIANNTVINKLIKDSTLSGEVFVENNGRVIETVNITLDKNQPQPIPYLNLSKVDMDIAKGELTNTTTQMEYSVNNGTTWVSCTDKVTTINYKDGDTVLVRQRSIPSNVKKLGVLVEAEAPQVTLNDDILPNAVFVENGEQVKESDGYEYTLDNGNTWNEITDTTTVDASDDSDIKVRVKATQDRLASKATNDLDASVALIDLSGVSLNIAGSKLEQTTPEMEYSMNGGVSWTPCTDGTTSVIFKDGDHIKIRQMALVRNSREIGTLVQMNAPQVTLNDDVLSNAVFLENGERIKEAAGYEYTIDNGDNWQDIVDTTTVDASDDADIKVRVKATKNSLASKATGDLDLSVAMINLQVVTTNIAGNMLEQTTNKMEYSVDGGVNWIACAEGTTSLVFKNGDHIKIRQTALTRNSRDLGTFIQENAPQVTLNDDVLSNAVFMENGEQVKATAGYEYTTDNGDNWQDIVDTTTVDASENADIRVRVKATKNSLASKATSDLDTSVTMIDLSGVALDVANNKLEQTTTDMEYSTNGGASWVDCTDATTSISFTDGDHVKIRQKSLIRNSEDLGTLEERNAPQVTLDDDTLATATFIENGEKIKGAAGYEYTLDNGDNWKDITDTTTVDASEDADIRVRVKATKSSLASQMTNDLDTSVAKIELSGVLINVARNEIDQTTSDMEYSVNGGGTWLSASNGVTSVTFKNGDHIKIRQKALTRNTKDLGTLTEPNAPEVELSDDVISNAVFMENGEQVKATAGYEYTLDNGVSWQDITNTTTVDATGDADIRVRAKATKNSLVSRMTNDLDTSVAKIELSGVTLNVVDNKIEQTTVDMEYSINGGGAWIIASNGGTAVTFKDGDHVMIRQKALVRNQVDLGTLTQPNAPQVELYDDVKTSAVFMENGTRVKASSRYEYTVDDGVTWNEILESTTVDTTVNYSVKVRVKASKITLASKVTQNLVIGDSIVSKSITNLDYGTVYASQAKGVSKSITDSNFKNNPKEFTVSDGTYTIPVRLDWDIPTSGFSPAQVVGSAIESFIQQYFKDNGVGIQNRTLAAYGFGGDTFNISTFATGSSSRVILGGKDWNYFFNENTFVGADGDTSKNRSFEVGDGTNSVTIKLNQKFTTIDQLISSIDNQLYYQDIQAQAIKVNETQFKIEALNTDVVLSIGGTDMNEFFPFD